MQRRSVIKRIITAICFSKPLFASKKDENYLKDDKKNVLRDEKHPNILVIYTDQQALWTISAYKNHTVMPIEIETPNIDKLAKEGVLLKNYFTNSSVCTPSRGCFVSGLYPHIHGAYKHNMPMYEKSKTGGTWGEHLFDAGYSTGWIGKWHLDGKSKPGMVKLFRGFGLRKWRWNRGHWKFIKSASKGMQTQIKGFLKHSGDHKNYTTNWLGDRTVDFLKSHVKNNVNKPFSLVVSFPDPHQPFKSYGKYEKMYQGKVTYPFSFYEENDPNPPSWHKKIVKLKKLKNFLKKKANYLGMVKCIDDNVGKIMNTLNEEKLSDNTIVIFTTDHGEFMGEHRLLGKGRMYEPAFHIPFILRWPNKIAANQEIDEFVSTVDIKPTLLSLVEINSNNLISQGRDASILFQQTTTDWKDVVYLHHASNEQTGIVTPKWFMAHFNKEDSVLYNREKDPHQVNNLANDSEYSTIMKYLTQSLYEHHVDVKNQKVLSWLINYQREGKY